jgi:hypothetical protein
MESDRAARAVREKRREARGDVAGSSAAAADVEIDPQMSAGDLWRVLELVRKRPSLSDKEIAASIGVYEPRVAEARAHFGSYEVVNVGGERVAKIDE